MSTMICQKIGLYFSASIEIITAHAIITILNMLISLFGIVANGVIIATYYRNARIRTIQNTIFLCLAVTDVGATAFAQPIFIVATMRKLLGNEDCLLWNISSISMMLFILLSLITVVILSFQSFLTLAFPYHRIITKHRLKMAIAVSWGFVILAIFALEIRLEIRINLYFTISIISVTIITVIFTWVWTYRLVARHRKAIQSTQTPSTSQSVPKAKVLRSTVTAFAVVLSLLGCYVFGVFFILFRILLNAWGITPDANLILAHVTKTLMFLNSLLNPCLVFWRSSEFREAVRNMMR